MMLAELLMHAFGWTDAWYAHPGPPLYGPYSVTVERIPGRTGWAKWWCSLRSLRSSVRGDGRCHVGVWTGPQHDLICVRKCGDNEQAERCLSPGGVTIATAAVKAAIKRVWLDRRAKQHSP